MHFRTLLGLAYFLLFIQTGISVNESDKVKNSQILNIRLKALTESLINMRVYQFQQLFDQKQVAIDTIFQPDFLFPNNVFASMGDHEFKNSLKIFTLFEPTTSVKGKIQALVTISYRMNGKNHKMEKEVEISKNVQCITGYWFTGFKSA